MLFDVLPSELLSLIVSKLDLRSIHRLAATCRRAQHLLHQDELGRWGLTVRNQLHLIWSQDGQDLLECDKESGTEKYRAVIKDETLTCYRELHLLSSPDFTTFLQQIRTSRSATNNLTRFLASIFTASSGRYSHDPDYSARLALFGPGIESPNTKTLVHKMINSHSSVFDAREAVAGLPGGFGSGIRMDFKKCSLFDLMCLYTNSIHVRESHRGVCRLKANHNRLLTRDALRFELSEEPALHGSVLKLLPTLDGMLFAIDVEDLTNAETLDEEFAFLRSELNLMLNGLDSSSSKTTLPPKPATPILILCCSNSTPDPTKQPSKRSPPSPGDIARALCLADVAGAHAWAVYKVDIVDMEGMVAALQWVLYHVQKAKGLEKEMKEGGH